MATASELYQSDSNYLNADDLKNTEASLTIGTVKIEDFDGRKKLVLGFVGKEKTLVANKTNVSVIISNYGEDFNKWPGKCLILFPSVTEFNGKTVNCIRVRVQKTESESEEIPF